MKNSTICQTNTGRDRASDVDHLPLIPTTQLSAVLANQQARPLANRPYLLRRGLDIVLRSCAQILCCARSRPSKLRSS
ncbi:hypothetical protein [Microcoleus sp. ARI1-A1]|uniref:hypothetical protein n=1 Tax=Microcoleus sp. ARI1-A1 TaxID=2818556 RepID=UPI002FD03C0A